MPESISIQAPLSGVLVPLEEVPDPVFSQKMVGDGIAIDPTCDVLVAPCDGEIIQVHPANHALTIRSHSGLELLIHIGIDTVKLKGEGLESRVKLGQRVKTGEELIRFSPIILAEKAKSLLSMVVFTNEEYIKTLKLADGIVTATRDELASIELAQGQSVNQGSGFEPLSSKTIIIPNPTGLHARPSAVLANLCKRFESKLELQKGDQRANCRSIVSLLALEVSKGDKVRLVAQGSDAAESLAAIVPELETGLGEEGATPILNRGSSPSQEKPSIERPRSDDESLLLGVSASPGIAVGKALQLRESRIEVDPKPKGEPDAEQKELTLALEEASRELEALVAKLHTEADPSKAAIFVAHQELLEDPDLLELASSAISRGLSAAAAWQRAFENHAQRLANLKNQLLAERANDVKDVGRRVLRKLANIEQSDFEIPEGSVLLAEDLSPSETAKLDPKRVVGFCTTAGGATSHVAILARSLGIPAICSIESRALDIKDGTPLILLGDRGELKTDPSEQLMEAVKKTLAKREKRKQEQLVSARQKAETKDGHRVEVAVNIGGLEDAGKATNVGAEGVGLLRSEFLFLGRSFAPTEEEQFESYRRVAQEMGEGLPIVIRTLDVGGDKPLPYLPIPPEENPFLGQRGIRVLLNRPEVLRPQIRAILRASEQGKMHIMFPMITTLDEFKAAKKVVQEEQEKLGLAPIPVGLMIEVPAAALIAESLAKEADFFSIGTNDLTQYTLAMDRGHPQLASQIDGLNPAVLKLIKMATDAAHAHDAWVGVCGGMAGEPQAIPILVGLGVDELSVSLPLIPAVKARVREFSLEQCQALADEALSLESATQVRALCPDTLMDEVTLS